MTQVKLLEALTDLKAIADELRQSDAPTAIRIEQDRYSILEAIPPLTSDEAAEQLKVTRPTIHSWVERRVLDRHEASSDHHLLITAESVADILPAVLRWHSEGKSRGAMKVILEELEGELDGQLVRRAAHHDPRRLPPGFGVLPPAEG
jgi:hypothetical protein